MSNSDQKLDGLYKNDRRSSPADLDATIRGAARKAIKQSDEHGATSAASKPVSWHRRYGWASAAAVLLTCVVFVQLPEQTTLQNPPSPVNAPLTATQPRTPPTVVPPAPTLSKPPAPAPAATAEVEAAFEAEVETNVATSTRALFKSSPTELDSIPGVAQAAQRARTPVACATYAHPVVRKVCRIADNQWQFYAPDAGACANELYTFSSSLASAPSSGPSSAPASAPASAPNNALANAISNKRSSSRSNPTADTPSVRVREMIHPDLSATDHPNSFVFHLDDGRRWQARCVSGALQLNQIIRSQTTN